MSADKFAHIPKYLQATAMTATITGPWIPIMDKDNVSFQVVSTAAGAPVGLISFEVTNAGGEPPSTLGAKTQPPSTAPVTALTLTTAQTTAATINNNTLSFVFEFTQLPEAWIRAKYTRTSGGTADTMTVLVCAKAI